MNRDLRKLPEKLLAWLLESRVPRHHWRRYAMGGLCSIFAILGLCGTYLIVSPKRYTSEWSVILPGAGINTRIAVDRIGQTQSSAASPFSGKGLNPRINYKEIATSNPVLRAVANKVGQPIDALNKLKVKLIKQSSIMVFKTTSHSPEEAQRRAWAFHEALKERLDALRSNEAELRNSAIRSGVGNVEKNLTSARRKLLELQLRSGLTSVEQYKQMVSSIENLRVEQSGLQAKLAEKSGQVQSLASKLGIQPDDVTPLFLLSTDPEFRELLKALAAQSAAYVDLASRLGSDHPRVREAVQKKASLTDVIKDMGRRRGGSALQLSVLSLAAADHDRVVELLSELIRRQSETDGLDARNKRITSLLAGHEARRVRLGAVAAKLDDLERDHQIANAVFGSALARIDASKSDFYASYPLLQMLQEPSLPESASSPDTIFAIIGGILGSLLAAMAWTFAWLHQWFAAIRSMRRSYSPQFA